MEKKRAGCGTFIIVWVIAAGVFGVFFKVIDEKGQSVGSIVFGAVLVGFLMAVLIWALRMAGRTIKDSIGIKKQVRQHKERYEQQKERDEQEGISRYSVTHVGGLPAPENCKADVVLSKDALAITCGGNEYVINIEKIRNVDSQLDVNVMQYLESSVARGVIGAMLFGTSGAVIGSAPRTKMKSKIKGYAIITYEDAQGEYKTFLLKDVVDNTKVCSRLVDDLRPRINQQINRVEL